MNPSAKHSPLVRKSASFPFQIAVVCWIDLLGYGAMIAEADFNPLHPKASEAMQRLRRFHAIVASHSFRHFPTLVMNDGAVAYRDLSLRSRGPTFEFLMRAWNLFNNIKDDEAARGLPGARVVLATGFRMRGRRAGMDATAAQFRSLMRRYQDGEIAPEQAMREAASIRQRSISSLTCKQILHFQRPMSQNLAAQKAACLELTSSLISHFSIHRHPRGS